MGKLYLVGTPIGNLGDVSHRALETLRMVDFIAAEDTRVSLRLLNHFDISRPLISYHEHNARARGREIAARILAGENGALITDAGMPCISDPGEDIVRLLAEAGAEVVAVPGPSAFVTALALSGLSTGRFCFEGFLTVNRTGRRVHLESLRQDTRTLVFYEAPHKLRATLEDMAAVLGDRRVSLCRELTKLHEQVVRTTLAQAVERYRDENPRGEFVIVVEGAPPPEPEQITDDEAERVLRELRQSGLSASQAAREAAKTTGRPRSELYALLLREDV